MPARKPTDRLELYRMVFPDGKMYIGVSVNSANRKESHRRASTRAKLTPVSRAIAKYGMKNVHFEVLAIGSVEYILELEIAAIRHFQTTKWRIGHNRHLGGFLSPMTNPEIAAARKGKSQKGNSPEAYRRASVKIRAQWDAMTPEQQATQIARLHDPAAKEAHDSAIRSLHAEGLWHLPSDYPRPHDIGERISSGKRGYIWITNGKQNRGIRPEEIIPSGWRRGLTKITPMTPEIRRAISKSVKRYFDNQKFTDSQV